MQVIENERVSDDARCGLIGFPAAIRAGRDLQALNIQRLADLLDCMPTFALLIDELSN